VVLMATTWTVEVAIAMTVAVEMAEVVAMVAAAAGAARPDAAGSTAEAAEAAAEAEEGVMAAAMAAVFDWARFASTSARLGLSRVIITGLRAGPRVPLSVSLHGRRGCRVVSCVRKMFVRGWPYVFYKTYSFSP